MKNVFLIFTILALYSCHSKVRQNIEGSAKTEKIEKELTLDYDFKIELDRAEDFGEFTTYTFFRLSHNNNIIFIDSTLTEYQFEDKLYPIVLKPVNDKYELLFEINDRPNKNYLKRIIVIENKVVQVDKLPTFISGPKDLDDDGIKEYAGFWDYGQIWGENNSLTAYNPILYYSISENGLELDSSLTIEKNRAIYGDFHGFEFSEKQEMPISTNEAFDKEISFITK